uniref:ribosomal protein S9 n=1 Tax=Chlorococcum tatrense TaxID=915274 RepID=UPI0010C2E7D7|nr:ribosomal protein S9 [Chlorococcum tatrense]AYQ94333.1 ribosomal protein S9 [Chlorococcum tatrense]
MDFFYNLIKMEILARGVGRRKEAVAQVQIVKGTGNFLINNIPAQQYLHNNTYSMLSVKAPLNALNSSTVTNENGVEERSPSTSEQSDNSLLTNVNSNQTNNQPVSSEGKKEIVLTNFEKIDTIVKVKGGGLIGQAEAIKLGLARALCSLTTNETGISEEEIRKQLKDKGYLTQDSRVKERRKYGLKKARKATQYNKR